jgi:hypothetical protein
MLANLISSIYDAKEVHSIKKKVAIEYPMVGKRGVVLSLTHHAT